MKEMWEGIKGMAQQAGRNPDDLDIVVRANLMLMDSPAGDDRFAFMGSSDQIKADIEACREMLKRPVEDAARYDRVWQEQVRSLDGAYEMKS